MKMINRPTLADSICDLRTRKIKKTFFTQINTLLNWDSVSNKIDKYYKKGKSATGSLLMMVYCYLKCVYLKPGMV